MLWEYKGDKFCEENSRLFLSDQLMHLEKQREGPEEGVMALSTYTILAKANKAPTNLRLTRVTTLKSLQI